jgi:pyroglutamyl-peptidase
MKLLVTGFPPFPGRPENPSQRIVEAVQAGGVPVPDVECRGVLLPVEYQGVETAYLQRIGEFRPDVVLAFGVGRQESLLRLETRGVNRDEAAEPDNAGEVRSGTNIVLEGPEELHAPLDLVPLADAIRHAGIEIDVSRDAGTYICNHLLYFAWHHLAGRGAPRHFVFSHVCPMESGFELEQALVALRIMATWFRRIHPAPENE